MQTLKLNVPLRTTDAQVTVDTTLKPGKYRVQLVVSGTHGTSAPATASFVILAKRVPVIKQPIALNPDLLNHLIATPRSMQPVTKRRARRSTKES